MEINVTSFFATSEPYDFSGSVAERGQNAGQQTWSNAIREAANSPLLQTDDELEAMRHWALESGGWDKEEIAAWSATEVNALFIQLISGDMRELEAVCSDDNGEINWARSTELAGTGTVAGNLYRSDDGKIWYYLGS